MKPNDKINGICTRAGTLTFTNGAAISKIDEAIRNLTEATSKGE